MSLTFDLKDSKGKTFVAVVVGPRFELNDGRLLQYVDVEDTFRISETGEVLMRPFPSFPTAFRGVEALIGIRSHIPAAVISPNE